jgi:hypothetical protein
VPVWLVNDPYGSKTYQVLANGYTRTIACERPYSWVRNLLRRARGAGGVVRTALESSQGQ